MAWQNVSGTSVILRELYFVLIVSDNGSYFRIDFAPPMASQDRSSFAGDVTGTVHQLQRFEISMTNGGNSKRNISIVLGTKTNSVFVEFDPF